MSAGADTAEVEARRALRRHLRGFGPRELRSATRSASALTATGAALTATFAVLAPAAHSGLLVNWGAPALLTLVTVALVTHTPRAAVALLCLLTPLLGVAMILALDLDTRDASAAAQVFFCLPVLYACSHLRVLGAVLITLSALASSALVSLTVLPTQPAVTDVAYIGVTLALTAAVLVRAGLRHDGLVAQLRAQATIDPLTGLVTRRVLDDAARLALVTEAERQGTVLIVVDVDRFKVVNDTHGHPVGDDALSHIGGILTAIARSHDVVARMGGDELAVLMPGCTYDAGVARAEQLVREVRDTPLVRGSGGAVVLSVSAGVAHIAGAAAEVRDLYASADAALYQAKRGGRGRVECTQPAAFAVTPPEMAELAETKAGR